MYSNMAKLYDELMNDVDYDEWYLYIKKIFNKFNKVPKTILEMACGTGNLSYYFANNGFDLTCFDISPEMLSIAYNKLNAFKNIRIIQQNMIDFKINEKFDAIVSVCDGINYILDEKDLLKVFQNVKEHLQEDGIFVFDISSYYKLKHIIGNNTFIEDRDEIYYTWQNHFDNTDGIAEFYLTFFVTDGKGKYVRVDERHLQKAYHVKEIIKLLQEVGFATVYNFDGITFDQIKGDSQRISIVALK